MNNTTTTATSPSYTYATGSNALEQFYALFITPPITILFYRIGYTFTFFLGFLGNTMSLLTFTRPTLRKISTGCLFIVLAVFDTLYLFMCVFDYLEFGFKVPFYGHVAYNELCRFRSFVMFVSQVASSWILVIVSIDRWIRTRFPFKSASICTPKKALMAVSVLLVIDIGLHSHILMPIFGMLIPGYANGACGPRLFNNGYLQFYYFTWSMIQVFVNCLVPAFLMLIILADIFITVRMRKRTVLQVHQDAGHDHRQGHAQKQMFILMFASICIFLVTNLPLGIGKIILPAGQVITQASLLTSIWTGLQWLQSLNYAVNFYVHCLTSTLFRTEFIQRMKILFHVNRIGPNNTIYVAKTGSRAQTLPR